GTGEGLRELHRIWPQAALHGLEWSWPWRLVAGLRCPWARVRRGDIWAADWSPHDLVYLFQRPESMPRAWAKASGEMRPGAWLVSLEFAVPGLAPQARLQAGAKPVWVYRIPARPA
ncbi:MAG: class I SAM-dependent methyltransferase, partial [Aquabacterium sp.]|nr:class I SAM-dependent methyltransferase [Aquabacterium sp.]